MLGLGCFISEVLFGLYWIITQIVRWNVVYRYEDELPVIDVFVCTADPILEPPSLAQQHHRSTTACRTSAGFRRRLATTCLRHSVEPRSPVAYFALNIDLHDSVFVQEWSTIKKLYEDMKTQIASAVEKGRLSSEIKGSHSGTRRF
ncbi:cellulose synthase E6 [Olea europaea subsp. europaea]|uniref:Cellulose synthase E6 n=1 Tax=Olea europaea subsp. europaea TaxID=158383 RepID=A0A8S0R100_OLEEU|nr:cellulose synthase E6 [Olea europaea subsp. europaea]